MEARDFREIDEELEKYAVRYDDVDVTYLLRNHLVAKIRTKAGKGNAPIRVTKQVLLRFVFAALKTCFNAFAKKDIWVFSNAERRKQIGDCYIDRVTSIVSEVYPSTLYIENPVLTNHKFPSTDRIFSEAALFFLSFLCSRLYFTKSKLQFTGEVAKLEKKYEVQLNVMHIVRRFEGQRKAMSLILKYGYQPKCVFMAYPGSYNGYIVAFKRNKIPVIELQHGVIYPLHPSYNYWYSHRGQFFRPDCVFTYGSQDKECLIDLGYADEKQVHIIGSYGLWKNKQDDKFANAYIGELIKGSTNILLITATSNDIIELYNFAKELAHIHSELMILLLPRHPSSLPTEIKNLKILDVTKANVFECYKVARFHLTQNSTCALETLYMDIPTFIFDPDGSSLFQKNYSNLRSLNYVQSAVQLNEALRNNSFTKPSTEDIAQVYAEDVKKNFQMALATLNL